MNEPSKEDFYKAGWGQNEVMWKCWCQAYAAGREAMREEVLELCDEFAMSSFAKDVRSLKP